MKDKHIGFGIYHLEYGEPGEKYMAKAAKNKIVNTFVVGGYNLERVYKTMVLASEYDCKVWIWLNLSIWTNSGLGREKLVPDWEDKLVTMINICMTTNSSKCLNGFIIEEPLICFYDEKDVIKVTQYCKEVLHTNVMINFSAYEVDKSIISHKKMEHIANVSAQLLQYVTDVSIIHYKDFSKSENEFVHMTKTLLDLCNPETKMWYIPCVIKIKSIQTEKQAMEHLMGCYHLLKQLKNPGGLICYSWKSEYGLTVGLEDLTDAFAEEYWEKIIPKIREVSSEINGLYKNNFV